MFFVASWFFVAKELKRQQIITLPFHHKVTYYKKYILI